MSKRIYSIINEGKELAITHLTDNVFTFEGKIEVTDGYHTMQDLYEHRYRLFLALVKIYDNYITPLGCDVKCWKSLLHSDGTMFEDSFILGMTVKKPSINFTDKTEEFQITYHLPMRLWHLAKVMEYPRAFPWDGHDSDDVLERLLRL